MIKLTEGETQTAIVAVLGLERLYDKLKDRGHHDDRLVRAIDYVKAMLRDSVSMTDEPKTSGYDTIRTC